LEIHLDFLSGYFLDISSEGEEQMDNLNAFLNMMQSVDAFFPIGAFTLSNGMETYVQQEKIMDCTQLQEYIEAYMQTFPYQDLGLMYHAYLHADKEREIIQLDQLCSAMKSASQIRNGSNKMCLRFLKAEEKMTANTVGNRQKQAGESCLPGAQNADAGYLGIYRRLIKTGRAVGYHPIALGIYAAGQKMNADMALGMYGYSVLSAIVNNAVKLVPLSQIEGQYVLYDNIPAMVEAIETTKKTDSDMLGISGSSYDIRCMQHEKLYSRLYMS
jgi:urease accessory protein